MDNLTSLLPSSPDKEDVQKLEQIEQSVQVAANNQQVPGTMLYVVVHAAKTTSQIRYEPDVRERLLTSEKYYTQKHKLDQLFRAKKRCHVDACNKIESNSTSRVIVSQGLRVM